MALTLGAARSRLQSEYLDDAPAGKRWSTAALNRALYAASVGVLEECARHRVTRLLRTVTGNTSGGELSVPKNCLVTAVYLNSGSAKIPLRQADFPEISPAVQANLTVEYIPSVTEQNSDADYLLNDPSDAALVEWPALEEWILASAAMICYAKEPNPRSAGAKRVLDMFRAQVLEAKGTSSWGSIPAPGWNVYEDLLRWGYDHQNNRVVLSGVPA